MLLTGRSLTGIANNALQHLIKFVSQTVRIWSGMLSCRSICFFAGDDLNVWVEKQVRWKWSSVFEIAPHRLPAAGHDDEQTWVKQWVFRLILRSLPAFIVYRRAGRRLFKWRHVHWHSNCSEHLRFVACFPAFVKLVANQILIFWDVMHKIVPIWKTIAQLLNLRCSFYRVV